MPTIRVIEMTPEERALYGTIQWEGGEWLRWEHKKRIEMLENIKRLTESLIKRKAVPQVRLDYFLKPEMNAGGNGKS